MKIFFYIGHPAQYHFFRWPTHFLRQKNHEVTLIIKSKDILETLLKIDNQPYINILPEGRDDNSVSMFWALIKRELRLTKLCRKIKPNILIGSDPSVAHVGRLLGIPSIICSEDDVDIIPKLALLTFPFAKHIFSSEACNIGKWSYKKIVHKSYQKLGYLHPNYFKPNKSFIGSLAEEKYFLIRLAKLTAHHDNGAKGLDVSLLRSIINKLSAHGKIYISSEAPLVQEFEKYSLNVNLNHIHHVIYYSEMLICDSQSMTVEAAMLGTPSIRFNDFAGRIGVLEELEHVYGLTYGIKSNNPGLLLKKIDDLISLTNLKSIFLNKRAKMLLDKIDITAYLVWLIDNYPDSIRSVKANPEFQNKFK
jgi:predicted glycosyltransferase